MKHFDAQIIIRRTIWSILNPCYDSLRFNLKGPALSCQKYKFCATDFTHCVGRTWRKYCVDRPFVPSTWPMQIRTNLIQFEVTTLEEAWFILCEAWKCASQTFFISESTLLLNWLVDLTTWPKTCNNKANWPATNLKLST